MKKATIPKDENKRLEALRSLHLLDTKPEERFDVLTQEAVKLFGVKISTISLVDKDREFYKSCVGLESLEGPREVSFCGHALLSESIFIIEDTKLDDRFKDNPYVVGPPFIRFYAGVVLREKKTGYPVGVFCIKDDKPRKLGVREVAKLIEFGQKAEEEINRTVKKD